MGLGRRRFLRVVGAGAALGSTAVAGARTRTDPDGYAPMGSVDVRGSAEVVTSADGETAFVAVGDGFVTVDVSDPATPRVLARRRDLAADREAGPLVSVLDVALDGEELLVSGPAQRGSLRGLLVFDVSDPAAPERVTAFAETAFTIHNAEFADGYAYLTNNASPDRPLTIYDTTTTVDGTRQPTEVARWSPLSYDAPVDGWDEVGFLPGVLHDVTVTGDVAYCAYWDAGTWLVDVSDPTAPAHLGRAGDYSLARVVELANSPGEFSRLYGEAPGNDHYAAASDDGRLLAVGGEAWDDPETEGGGPAGIDIYDTSDPTAPTRLATIDHEPADDTTRAGTWVTAHNFEIRDRKLYSAWYDAGVKVHDLSDPSNPELLSWWLQPDVARFWTARVAAPGETFVATSYGLDGHRSALYVFPDRPGLQADRPSLTSGQPTTRTATATATDTPTDTPTRTTGESTRADTTAATGEATPTPTDAATDERSEETPGFGPLAAVGALGYGVYRYLRRAETE